MHFDDRLATVLRHRAGGERAARTQYRQLLDLLGQRRHGKDGSLLAAAWLRLGALGEAISAADRAAILREAGWHFRNPELAAHLAEDEPPVAAAALAAARLEADDWAALIPRLPVRARGFLRLRRDLPDVAVRILDRLGVSDLALPLPEASEPLVLTEELPGELSQGATDPDERRLAATIPVPANDAADNPAGTPAPSMAITPEDGSDARPTAIAELVERIEAFQRSRSEAREAPATEQDSHPPLPFAELQHHAAPQDEAGIIFTTDAEGRIDWAEEALAPMLRYLVFTESLDRDARQAVARRLPITSSPVVLEGAPRIAGKWYCDAAPRFDPHGGRFIGYAARLRRMDERETADETDESDRIRQLLHELRTPVNAIQGFAEVIQQQLFGPVPHEYRGLAANIAGDAARILAGFDELDRLAKLESGARRLDSGVCDFSAVAAAQLRQLEAILAPRNASFVARIDEDCTVALAQNEAESMCWRIVAAIAAALAPAEHVAISLTQQSGTVTLESHLPASLRARSDIFAAETQKAGGAGVLTPGSFGSGFALRLARAEARSAGGDLTRTEDRIVLTLPLLTGQVVNSSAAGSEQEAARPGLS